MRQPPAASVHSFKWKPAFIYPDADTRGRMRLIGPSVTNYDIFAIVYLKGLVLPRVTASGYIFRLTFRSLTDVSYSDECRTKKAFKCV